MTTTTSTTQPISQPSYACLRVVASSPTCLLKHLLVLVLAHLLAPLLDYRAQSNSLRGSPRTQGRILRVRGAETQFIYKMGTPAQRGARESYRKLPAARSSLNSPSMYFSDAHEELRLHIRKFLEKEVQPHLEEWEEKTFPDSIFKRFGELGFLGLRYPPEYGGQGGDYFSAVVLSEEMARTACGGLGMAVAVQAEMATPPVFKFGTEEQKRRWLAPAIRGEQIAALAITEPDAGSDVAGITTVARRDGGDPRDVRARIRFGDGEGCDLLAADRRRQPPALLLFGSELENRRRGHLRLDRDGHPEPAAGGPGHLLGEDDGREVVPTLAAVFRRVAQAQEPELAKPLEDRVGEGLLLPLLEVRLNLLLEELPDVQPEFLVGVAEVHRG